MHQIGTSIVFAICSVSFGIVCVLLTIAPDAALVLSVPLLIGSGALIALGISLEDRTLVVAASVMAVSLAGIYFAIDVFALSAHVTRDILPIWLAPIQLLIAVACLQSISRVCEEWGQGSASVSGLAVAMTVAAIMFTLLGRTSLMDAFTVGWANYLLLTIQSVLLSHRLWSVTPFVRTASQY